MQSVINSVKGTALGVAEYLTPVLKVIFYFAFFSFISLKIEYLSKLIIYFGYLSNNETNIQ